MDDFYRQAVTLCDVDVIPFSAAVGFDGYIDKLLRVVRTTGETPVFYDTISELSKVIGGMANLSGELELHTIDVRIGGNAPLFAVATAALGGRCLLAGATEDAAFVDMPQAVDRIDLSPPGQTLALEFDDGKVMFADVVSMRGLEVQVLENTELWQRAMRGFNAADLCAIVNWSAATWMHTLWESVADHITSRNKLPYVFLDLADLEKRTSSDVNKLVELIGRFDPAGTVLGLNEKESVQLSTRLVCAPHSLAARLGCGVLIHSLGYSELNSTRNIIRRQCPVVQKPLMTTGAGDHFNAAFCFAMMHKVPAETALDFANAVAGCFVKTGQSPDRAEVKAYLMQLQ